MNFYETKMGQEFFCRQIPALIEALQNIAKEKPLSIPLIRPIEGSKERADILFDLFYGNYQPESLKRMKDNALEAEVKRTMDALLSRLPQDAHSAFYRYESAVNARGSCVMMQAFKDGFQLAVQLFQAGSHTTADDEEK